MAYTDHTPSSLDLPTVAEHPSTIYPNLPTSAGNDADPDVEEERAIQRRSVHEDKSPGGVSIFSGTTARASRSAQELLGLNAEDMLDALQDLSDTSDKLLRLLAPPGTSNAEIGLVRSGLKDPESRISKNLRRLHNGFRVSRDLYGSSSYIHSAAVLQTLLGGKRTATTTYGSWRPDPLLQKANLCSLLLTVLAPSQKLRSVQAIEELETSFPASFLHSFVTPELLCAHAGSSALRDETFVMGLELRTQYVITLLTQYIGQASFDPDKILSQVFYQEKKNELRGWDLVGLKSEELPKAFKDIILHRLNLIRKHFLDEPQASNLGELVDIERLKAEFSWENFVIGVVAWSKARLDELQRQINISDGDGAENIKHALDLEIQKIVKPKSLIDDDVANIDEGGPEVVLDYEPPSERSHAPIESIDTTSRPAPLASKLNGPAYK